jgi:hypothetical protein
LFGDFLGNTFLIVGATLFMAIPGLALLALAYVSLVRPVLNTLLAFLVLLISPEGKKKKPGYTYHSSSYSSGESSFKREDSGHTKSMGQELAVDAYEVFGFSKGQDIDAGRLKKRYYELQKRYHPDIFSGSSDDDIAKATEDSKRINWAYSVLRSQLRIS